MSLIRTPRQYLLQYGIAIAISIVPGDSVRPATAASYQSLHDFYAYPSGASPDARLLKASDGKLYGAAISGGFYGMGTIYRVNLAGSLTVMYSFRASDNVRPINGPLVEGGDGAFYGMGGARGDIAGRIFRFSPKTGEFSIIHVIKNSDGLWNPGALTVGSDGALYGFATAAYPNTAALLYRCATSGAFSIVRAFTQSEGAPQFNSLCATPDKHLYGVLRNGGSNGLGGIFKMSLAGDLKVIYSFSQTGGFESSPIILGEDGKLWGIFSEGGPSGVGGIYQVSTLGAGFHLVHSALVGEGFILPSNAGLTLGPDHRYYGRNDAGGGYNAGNIFAVSSDGAFRVLYEGMLASVAIPADRFTTGEDGNLYGVIDGGGNRVGAITRLTPAGQYKAIANFTATDGSIAIAAPVLAADGSYYGVTIRGGHYDGGTLYRQIPGGKYAILHSFSVAEGSPSNIVIGADGSLYGLTTLNAFKMGLDGTFTILAHGVSGGLITASNDGSFYFSQGSTVHKMDSDGVIADVAQIPSGYGYLVGPITLGSDGNLYVVSQYGGENDCGAILKSPVGGVFSTAYSFTGGQDGKFPFDSLAQGPDGNLYGATAGGNYTSECVFRYEVSSGSVKPLYTFLPDQATPVSPVAVKADGTIVGIGMSNHSFAYTVSPGGVYTEQVVMPGINNAVDAPLYDLLVEPGGVVAGTAALGGVHGNGAIFTLPGL